MIFLHTIFQIKCDVTLLQSVSSKIPTIDTPKLTREVEIWVVLCESNVWFALSCTRLYYFVPPWDLGNNWDLPPHCCVHIKYWGITGFSSAPYGIPLPDSWIVAALALKQNTDCFELVIWMWYKFNCALIGIATKWLLKYFALVMTEQLSWLVQNILLITPVVNELLQKLNPLDWRICVMDCCCIAHDHKPEK